MNTILKRSWVAQQFGARNAPNSGVNAGTCQRLSAKPTQSTGKSIAAQAVLIGAALALTLSLPEIGFAADAAMTVDQTLEFDAGPTVVTTVESFSGVSCSDINEETGFKYIDLINDFSAGCADIDVQSQSTCVDLINDFVDCGDLTVVTTVESFSGGAGCTDIDEQNGASCVDEVYDYVASVRFKSLVYDPQRPDALEHEMAVEEVEFFISSERGEVETLRLLSDMQTLAGESVLHIDAYDSVIVRGANGEPMSVILVSDDGLEIMRLAIAKAERHLLGLD